MQKRSDLPRVGAEGAREELTPTPSPEPVPLTSLTSPFCQEACPPSGGVLTTECLHLLSLPSDVLSGCQLCPLQLSVCLGTRYFADSRSSPGVAALCDSRQTLALTSVLFFHPFSHLLSLNVY